MTPGTAGEPVGPALRTRRARAVLLLLGDQSVDLAVGGDLHEAMVDDLPLTSSGADREARRVARERAGQHADSPSRSRESIVCLFRPAGSSRPRLKRISMRSASSRTSVGPRRLTSRRSTRSWRPGVARRGARRQPLDWLARRRRAAATRSRISRRPPAPGSWARLVRTSTSAVGGRRRSARSTIGRPKAVARPVSAGRTSAPVRATGITSPDGKELGCRGRQAPGRLCAHAERVEGLLGQRSTPRFGVEINDSKHPKEEREAKSHGTTSCRPCEPR
jgi:hypothetical protein